VSSLTVHIALVALMLCGLQVGTAQVTQHAMVKAQKAFETGDFAGALTQFELAAKTARRGGRKKDEVAAVLGIIGSAEELMAVRTGQQLAREQAEVAYRRILEIGSKHEQQFAANNLAALLIDSDRGSQALQVLRDIELETLTVSERCVQLYNRGWAAEQTGDVDSAVRDYQDAVANNPAFKPAIHGVFRVLGTGTAESIQRIAKLAFEWSRNGNATFMLESLHELVYKSRNRPGNQYLVLPLVAVYVRLGYISSTFKAQEAEFILSLVCDLSG